MSEEKKTVDLNFIEQLASPPCVILAEAMAIMLVFYQHYAKGDKYETFVSWLLLAGEVLLYVLGIIIACFLVMLVCMIIAGGINIAIDHLATIIEIIAFVGMFIFGLQFL